MQAEGVVVRCEAELAYVKVQRTAGCGRCHETGGCGGNLSADAACQEYRVSNLLGAHPGDRVLLEVPQGATLSAAVQAYVVPLAAMLICAIGVHAFWPNDLAAVLGGAGGLALALLYMRSQRARQACRPWIAGILPS